MPGTISQQNLPTVNQSEKIWRYVDLAKFVSLLSSQSLYFACPNEFLDPYEGLYPKSQVAAFSSIAQAQIDQAKITRDKIVEQRPGVNVARLNNTIQVMADSIIKGFNEVRLKFGITCWHKNEVESEAMWKLYSASGQGIAIESTRGQLTESILEKTHLVIDDVRYSNFETDPIEKGHRHYGLFQKGRSFDYERELRGTVLLKASGKGTFVKCDLDALVTQIHISPLAPDYFRDVVEEICAGSVRTLRKPVLQSALFEKPGEGYNLNLMV
jgi:hypothetical protein